MEPVQKRTYISLMFSRERMLRSAPDIAIGAKISMTLPYQHNRADLRCIQIHPMNGLGVS